MKTIVFIGYIGKKFGDFLLDFNKKLIEDNKYQLYVLALGVNDQAFSSPHDELNILKIQSEKTLWNPLSLDVIIKADFFIIWSGYYNYYANIRKFCTQHNLPYLLAEYSGIDTAYYFDYGFHAEAYVPDNNCIEHIDLDLIQKLIQPGYLPLESNAKNNIFESSNKNKILFLGIWDEAAGLNEANSYEIKHKLFPYFKSTCDAACQVVKSINKHSILMIKPHPKTSLKHKEILKNYANNSNIFYTDTSISVEELIKTADIIITLTSTSVILATYYLKPVILLGKTYLSNFPFALQYSEKLTLAELIKIASNHKISEEQRNEFFYSYLCNYETYSCNRLLNNLGVKSILQLIEKIDKICSTNPRKKKEDDFLQITQVIQNIDLIFEEVQKVTNDLNRQIEQAYNIQQDLIRQKEQVCSLQRELTQQKNQITKYYQENESLKQDLVQHKKQAVQHHQELRTILNSRSWKFMKFLKNLKSFITMS